VTQERSDADLVARYRETGAPVHFETLVRRHRDRVLRLVVSVLGPDLQADAEDVVQRVFLRVHDRLAGFRGGSRFGTWIHRIAYNLALDFKRTRLRRRRLLREGPLGVDARRGGPGRPTLEPEHAWSVQRALREVPDPYQTALRLHYWLDLPVSEIAEMLGVAVGTAKSYLHRGRKRLHEVLKEKELLP
jgi:RNA polymerase sigma-70 factor (ECF subfamily)